MSNKERFIEIVDIEKTIKYAMILFVVFALIIVGLIPIFRNKEYVGEIILSHALLLSLWMHLFTEKLTKRRKYLYRQLHDNGLSYLEINETIDKLKGES